MPPSPDRAAGNLVETTVGELSGALKRTIEDRFGLVKVRGEVSNYRGPHSSGHAYFSLKDEAARIDAVVWKTSFARLRFKPQEGLEVVATGKITTFPGKSAYQIVIDTLEPAGAGALMALLEQRRKVLAAEGLFDSERRRPLPFLPRRIGVVTSPTGAVIRDILHRIADRFPRDVTVWPVRVQGETAAGEVAAAITGFNALLPGEGALSRPDVLIVARGGGSLEDLWAFNEEAVVRAAAAGTIPLISAIGHETDTTLIDFVADLRAPTPSGAAEKAVPVRSDLLLTLSDVARRQGAAVVRLAERRRSDVKALARGLPAPESLVALPRQRLDRADGRLAAAVSGAGDRRRLHLARLAQRLAEQAPRTQVALRRRELARLEDRLASWRERAGERRRLHFAGAAQRLAATAFALGREIGRMRRRSEDAARRLARADDRLHHRRRDELHRLSQLLNTLGYRQVLARGFAVVRDEDGRPLRSTQAASDATHLEIEFADGRMKLAGMASRAQRTPPRRKPEQGTLF